MSAVLVPGANDHATVAGSRGMISKESPEMFPMLLDVRIRYIWCLIITLTRGIGYLSRGTSDVIYDLQRTA